MGSRDNARGTSPSQEATPQDEGLLGVCISLFTVAELFLSSSPWPPGKHPPQLGPALPHEFLHDLLHPHLQSQEADAIVPPEAEEVQQVPVGLLQDEMLSTEDGAPAHHLATVPQPCRNQEPFRSPSKHPQPQEALSLNSGPS